MSKLKGDIIMAKKKRYLIMDTETGGVGPKTTSLLSAAFIIADENLEVLKELHFKLKEKETNNIFHVTPAAMMINKIDLIAHNREAVLFENASSQLCAALDEFRATPKGKYTIIGHNVHFDVNFVNEQMIEKSIWDSYADYRILDTSTIGTFLKSMGMGPAGNKSSLKNWAEFLAIKYSEEDLHDALTDARLTLNVYKGFLNLLGN